MSVRVLAVPVATASVLLLATPTPASAGGWDSLRFERDHYLVGEHVTATSTFFVGALEGSGPIDGRTYHAYLMPREATESGFGMITPPDIPEGSIRLGTLDVSEPFWPKRYDGPYARASLTFTVPDVPTGDRAIGFCDDPCRHGSVGWLAWGQIRIVHTEREGDLLAALDRERSRSWRARQQMRQIERRAETLATDLAEAERALELQRVQAQQALRLERMESTTPSERTLTVTRRVEGGHAWWISLLGAALGLGVGIALGHRRRPGARIVVPDTVPPELELLASSGETSPDKNGESAGLVIHSARAAE